MTLPLSVLAERGSKLFARERLMRPAVAVWLEGQSLIPVFETTVRHLVDIIGVRFHPRVGRAVPEVDRLVSVELKLTDIAGVLSQCQRNREMTHQSYAAMPLDVVDRMRPATLGKFSAAGIGLLAVSQVVEVRIAAPDGIPTGLDWHVERLRRRFWRYLRQQISGPTETMNHAE